MKYKASIMKASENIWFVKAGKKQHFSRSVGSEQHAKEFAAFMSAKYYIEQAQIALKEISSSDKRQEIGHSANIIIDDVTDDLLNKGEVTNNDAHSWLA